jgi:hypothetical protein
VRSWSIRFTCCRSILRDIVDHLDWFGTEFRFIGKAGVWTFLFRPLQYFSIVAKLSILLVACLYVFFRGESRPSIQIGKKAFFLFILIRIFLIY